MKGAMHHCYVLRFNRFTTEYLNIGMHLCTYYIEIIVNVLITISIESNSQEREAFHVPESCSATGIQYVRVILPEFVRRINIRGFSLLLKK